jgi:LacI family transcriptional regulator
MLVRKRKIALALQWSFMAHRENILGALDYAAKAEHWDLYRIDGDPILHYTQLAGIKCDGILTNIHDERYLSALDDMSCPIVRVDNIVEAGGIPGVFPDDAAVGRFAAQYFLERRFSDFAVLTYPGEVFGQERIAAFMEEVKPHPCHVIELSDLRDANRYKYALKKFKEKDEPTAVFAVDDDLAIHLIYEARCLGIAIPDSLSVLGVGNNEFVCRKSVIPLSSIVLPERECGYDAARMLDELLDGKSVADRTLLPLKIVTRQSSDYFAVGDKLIARALRIIHSEFETPVSVGTLAKDISVNRRTLERRFRRVMKVSPLEEVMRVRMSRAQRMLLHSDKRIIEVAYEATFPDLKSMEIQFEKRLGMSPKVYREQAGAGLDYE